MFQTSAIEPGTLALLKNIANIPELQQFYLAGGTALALRYSHRLSIDLDFFSTSDFENEDIIEVLTKNFPTFTYRNSNNPIGVFGFINDVKVDFVKNHFFSFIDAPEIVDGVRLYSDKDLMAMKVFAILKRAVKKDFWDVYELLHYYSVRTMIDCYLKKYPKNQMLISIPQALTYFADAEESEEPVSLKGQTWEGVKHFIQQRVNEYLK
ncbi:MAG TPA: nucleotidyl transferase AbiEii/AbiGii toxin family protein [Flavipsychrobacter sp.]|nr:nucleotidyl transferase AbiEii/AbiGii toxin family protein [Flavipsychrobacter sp.]